MRPALFLPACPTDARVPVRKPKDGPTGPIFFKAYRSGQFRRLSNLFGPVEWAFQRQKFKPDTEIYEWLKKGEVFERQALWDREQFDEVRKAMKHDGTLKSYITKEGHIASGLLAQMTSLIVKNPASIDARHRIKFIRGLDKLPTVKEAEQYVLSVLNPPLSDDAKQAFMQELLMDKFSIPEYRTLLMSTGHRDLHEGRGRGAPSQWEFVKKKLSPQQVAAGYSRGGDLLGLLMTRVRARSRNPDDDSDGSNGSNGSNGSDDSDDSDEDVPLAQLARRQHLSLRR